MIFPFRNYLVDDFNLTIINFSWVFYADIYLSLLFYFLTSFRVWMYVHMFCHNENLLVDTFFTCSRTLIKPHRGLWFNMHPWSSKCVSICSGMYDLLEGKFNLNLWTIKKFSGSLKGWPTLHIILYCINKWYIFIYGS